MSSANTNGDEYIIDDPDILERVNRFVEWEKLPRRHFIQHIERGRLGKNVGLANGLKNINKYIYGTHKGRYTLIGADSGVGKSTLADFMYLLSLYEDCERLGRKHHIIYYSFEMSSHKKFLNWTSHYLWIKFGMRVPTAYIDGNITNNYVTEDEMKKVRIAVAFVERLMEDINFIEDPIHPTGIWYQLIKHFESIGTIKRSKPAPGKKEGYMESWTPNPGEEESITQVILDHGALLHQEQGFDIKKTMDLMSKYFVAARNIFDMSTIFIQQFNNELTSTNRDSFKKTTEASILPQKLDFADSTYTYRDADVVMGIIKPALFEIPKFMGIDVKEFKEYLIAMCLMKNRYGASNRILPLFFDPVVGAFYDLPELGQFMDPFIKLKKEIDACQLHYRT